MRNSESPNAVLNHPNHGEQPPVSLFVSFPLLLDDDGRQALGVLDVHGLNVAVELLLGTLLVVTFPGDADTEPVWDTLDALLPNLLVELGVETDIGRALDPASVSCSFPDHSGGPPPSRCRPRSGGQTYHGLVGEGLDPLDGLGALFLKLTPCSYPSRQPPIRYLAGLVA